jgi:hypothetical protein
MSASYKPDRKVNVVKLLRLHFNMGVNAAVCAISHGQVSIDGHTIHMKWAVDHWTEAQLYGRVLKCHSQEARIIGSRLVKDLDQMKLAAA